MNPFPLHDETPWNSHTLLSLLFDFPCRCFSSSFSPRPEISRRVLPWLFRLSSIRALPMSWPLNNSLLFFVEHVSLFCTHNWGWNMQCQLETCQTRFTFSLWPPPLLSSWLLFTSTHRPLFYQKTISRKKLRNTFKSAKIKCFSGFSIAKI